MAGPLDLRGRVTITNGGSGTLGAIRRDLTAIGNQTKRMSAGTLVGNALATGVANSKKFAANIGAASVGAWGLIAAVNKAETFNRNVFGVGTAALADNTKKVVDSATGISSIVIDYEKVAAAMADVEKVSLSLSKELGQSPSRISGIAEVLAKAGFDTEKIAAGTKAVAIAAVTDMETPVSQLGEFASVLDTIYKPRKGEAWGEFFARQLDIVRVAAGETRLSVGSMMEGLRPFSALYSILGNDEQSNAALLMSGVKKGGEATEVGHTLKSNMLRMLRSTAEATSRFSALGLRRSDYTDLSAMDPMRATGNLSRVFRNANIKGGFRAKLEGMMQKAIEGGTFDTDVFQDKIMNMVAKRAGVDTKDEVSRTLFEEKFANAIFAGGARFDMMRLLQDLITKNATAADIGTIFEGRRIGTNTQILEGLREHLNEYLQKLATADGSGLAATQKIYDSSNYGGLMRFQAMWEKFQISIANSGGLQTALGGLTRLFEVLGSLPQPVGEMVVAAGLLVVALTPLSMLFRGLATIARAVGALFGAGRVAAAGGAGLAAVMGAGAGVAGSTAAGRLMAGGMTAAGAAAANSKIGARMSAGMSASGAAGSAAGTAGRFGARALSRLLLPLGIGMAGYDAYTGYQKDGWKGALLNPLTLGMYSGGAGASETSQPASNQGSGLDPSAANQSAESVKQQIESVFASINLFAAGQQAMATLAAGITAGGAQAISAANSVAAGVRAAGQRVQLNTGPNMQPAR